MLKHKPQAYHNSQLSILNSQFSIFNLVDTIFVFFTAQNCLLNAQRNLLLKIREF